MGKKSSGNQMPQPINIGATIAAQSQANKDAVRESARVNSIDLYGPYGSVTYDRNPDGTPRAQITKLDPGAQEAFNTQQRITNALSGKAEQSVGYLPTSPFSLDSVGYSPGSVDTSNMFSFGSFKGPMPTPGTEGSSPVSSSVYDPRSYGDIRAYSDKAGDAVYNRAMSRLTPQIQQQDRKFEQMMADRGIPVGSEAYNSARESLGRQQTDARQAAMDSATAAAGQEAQRIMGMEQGLRSTAFGEDQTIHRQNLSDWGTKTQAEQNLRNQMIQELLLGRSQPMTEASMYLQGSPGVNVPNAPQTPNYNVSPVDVAGINNMAFQQQMAGYNANQARTNSMWQGGVNLASAGIQAAPYLLALSSKAYKHDDAPPTRLIELTRKMPVRTWRYRPNIDPKQEIHIGPYAEDWKDATGLGDGKTINLVDAFGVTLGCVQELDRDVTEIKSRLDKLEAAGAD